MIKAVIFDIYGVIVQSVFVSMRERFDLDSNQMAELKKFSKMSDTGLINTKQYLQSFADVTDSTYEEIYEIYTGLKCFNLPRMLSYIAELKKRYKLAILSNVEHLGYEKHIKPIASNFDVIVTSYESKLAKPERAIYKLCAQKLGLKANECVMIDDNPINCEGAMAAGMQAIQYRSLKQLKNELSNLLADSNN